MPRDTVTFYDTLELIQRMWRKGFFDLRMISLLVSMTLIVIIMMTLSPLGTLDTRLYYSTAEAMTFLNSLTANDLRNYRLVEYLDLFFIYKYSRCALLALSRILPARPKLHWLALVPGFFDLVETSNIIAALHMEPMFLFFPGLGVITFLKWASAAALVIFIVSHLAKAKAT